MPDAGHLETEALLRALEKRIAAEYRKANREITRKVNAYMSEFKRKDKEWREKLENGNITETEYKAWQTGQVMIGKRWEEMRHTLAQDYANTNDLAKQMAFDSMPDVYALNHNYATFEVEKGGKVDTSYTLYDRATVERLIRDDPKLLPDPRPGSPLAQKLAKHKELRWEEQHVQSVVLQSILQGESLEQTAKRFSQLTEMNYRQSVRYARTATTGAQNAGRVDGYKRAEKLGVDMKQVWLATLDGRTRHEHRVLDGQEVDVGEPFIMDGFKLKYPGDPAAPAHLLFNCRCTVIAKVKGVDFNVSDKTQRDDKIGDMSYEEWKGEHKTAPKPPENVPEGKAVEVKVDKPAKGEYKEEPIKPRALTAENEQTLREYTAGHYKYECGYADALMLDDEQEKQSALEYLHKYQVGDYENEKGVEFLEQQTKEIIETINSQPIDDIPLFRIERRSINKEMPFKEGDEISWGIRSTTRDEGFITRVRSNEEEGFEEAFHDDLAPFIYVIEGEKKHLNIAEYSEFNQAESLVAGKFKVLSVEKEKIERTVKKQTFEEALKDFPDKFEFFTSKKGNEMVKINEQRTAVTLEKAKREVYYNGETNNFRYIGKYEKEESAEKYAAQIIKLAQVIK